MFSSLPRPPTRIARCWFTACILLSLSLFITYLPIDDGVGPADRSVKTLELRGHDETHNQAARFWARDARPPAITVVEPKPLTNRCANRLTFSYEEGCKHLHTGWHGLRPVRSPAVAK